MRSNIKITTIAFSLVSAQTAYSADTTGNMIGDTKGQPLFARGVAHVHMMRDWSGVSRASAEAPDMQPKPIRSRTAAHPSYESTYQYRGRHAYTHRNLARSYFIVRAGAYSNAKLLRLRESVTRITEPAARHYRFMALLRKRPAASPRIGPCVRCNATGRRRCGSPRNGLPNT